MLALVSFPLVVLIYVGNLLSFFWADALYGLAIGLALPELLLTRLTQARPKRESWMKRTRTVPS